MMINTVMIDTAMIDTVIIEVMIITGKTTQQWTLTPMSI
jgi:hypothetical protein